MKSHPLAELFPMMEDAELKELAADIKANGLSQHIVTLDGMILDGRHRFRACGLANVNPTFTAFKGSDPLSFVVSANLHRRHLDQSQKAMAGAAIANLKQGNFSKAANLPLSPVTQAKAAKMVGVSERLVRDAKKVMDEKPEDVSAIKAGKKTIHAALSELPKPTPPPKQGQQKSDPRLFERLENELGAMLRKIDELHKQFPNGKHHGAAIKAIKDCMVEVEQWRKVKR